MDDKPSVTPQRIVRSFRMQAGCGRSSGFAGDHVIIAVALAIVVVLAIALLAPKRGSGYPRIVSTRSQLGVFSFAVEVFYNHNGFYPDALEDLIQQPAKATNWHGPYLKADVPRDPWNREYIYMYPGASTNKGFPYDLYSLGPTPNTNIIAIWDISDHQQVRQQLGGVAPRR